MSTSRRTDCCSGPPRSRLAERLQSDGSARQRFVREAIAAARLGRHEHIVTVHDIGDSGGRPFLVMEVQPGGSVEDWLRCRGRPRIDQALRWIAQTAAALDAAHEEGVVHRDVKPGNLLLDERGDVRVADFGLARPECTQTALTSSGEVVGTAGYVSPEQIAGRRATPASDQYALAVVARELLGPGLSAPAERVLEQAVAPEPERYPSAGASVAALEAALQPRGVRAGRGVHSASSCDGAGLLRPRGTREVHRDTLENFEAFEPHFELRDLGEQQVLAWGTIHVRGSGAASRWTTPTGDIFEVRDGEIPRWQDFGSKEKALEAAGLGD
jgi:hypothetical protein